MDIYMHIPRPRAKTQPPLRYASSYYIAILPKLYLSLTNG